MRILIADDHSIIRKGLMHILQEEYPSAFIKETEDAGEAIKASLSGDWDVVVCDLSMPGQSGLEVVRHMKQHFPKTPVLVLSMYPEEQHAIRVLRAGAAGYLSKDSAPEELVKAVRTVLLGRRHISPDTANNLLHELELGNDRAPHASLSPREFVVFQLVSSGKSVSAIAKQLSVAVSTISTYRTKILAKMKMTCNADLTRYALENKLM